MAWTDEHRQPRADYVCAILRVDGPATYGPSTLCQQHGWDGHIGLPGPDPECKLPAQYDPADNGDLVVAEADVRSGRPVSPGRPDTDFRRRHPGHADRRSRALRRSADVLSAAVVQLQ